MRSGRFRLSALVLALILISSILHLGLISSSSSSVGNTGFEPWYYYIGGIVNSANGNLYFFARDISFKARGFDIELVRAYNSHRSAVDSGFGFGWTFNYNVCLVESGATVSLVEGDGSVHNFTDTGGCNYSAPAGIHTRLTKNMDGSFILWSKDGATYEFSSVGALLNIIDKNGNRLNFSYTNGKLSRVEDDSGLALVLNYNAQNRISSVVDPLSRQIRYEYDVSGNLKRIIDAMGYSTSCFYDSVHRIEAVVNPIGRVLAFSYLTQEGVSKVGSIGNSRYNFTSQDYYSPFMAYSIVYDVVLNTVCVTKRSESVTRIELNDVGNPIRIIDPLDGSTSMSWDSNMNMVASTDANGHKYRYQFDSLGNLLNETDPLGYSTIQAWNNTDTSTRYASMLANVTNSLGYVTSYDHDEKGNLVKTTDAMGNSSYQYYDSFGNVIKKVDFHGFETLYSYSSRGYMVNSTDALGNVTRYYYDNVGRLTNVTDPLGSTTSYEYDANDRDVKVIDATGNVTMHSYDSVGNLISTLDAKGNNSTTTVHEYINQPREVTDATGNKTRYNYDPKGNVGSVIDARGYRASNITYDALDRVVSVIDALGYVETYTYDAVGNILTKMDKRGCTFTYVYDAMNRIIRVRDPLGYNTTYQYDGLGRLVSVTNARGYSTIYVYDTLNRLIKEIDATGNATTYAYDANGNRISKTNALDSKTTYGYDALNRLIVTIDPLGNSTYNHFDGVGNLIKVVDPRGYATTYEYDALKRLIRVIDLQGYDTRYSYDALGNRILTINAKDFKTTYIYDKLSRLTGLVDATGNMTKYSYDALGNLISLTDARDHTTNYSYDALNRLVNTTDALGSIEQNLYDAAGNKRRFVDALSHDTNYEYDWLNRLAKVIDPYGSVTRYFYDAVGNLLMTIDANGHETEYAYDALDRLVKITDALNRSHSYSYDAVGNLLVLVDPRDNCTAYGYDALGRLTNVTDALGNATSYVYDAVGNVVRLKDPNDATSVFTYDALNRLTKAADPLNQETVYSYDAVNNRISTVDANGHETEYQYDSLGHLIKVTDSMNLNTTYAYDANGNIIAIVDRNGHVMRREYNALNRITKAIWPSGNEESYLYDAACNVIARIDANGNTTNFAYNALSYLELVSYPNHGYVELEYDPKMNIISISNKRIGLNDTTYYTYDALDRVISVTVNYGLFSKTINYTYDPTGNRKNMIDPYGEMTTYDYDSVNRLTKITDSCNNMTTFKYDAVGRRIRLANPSDVVTAYVYDVAGRLLNVTTKKSNGVIVSSYIYSYDSAGNILNKTEYGVGTTSYQYDAIYRLSTVTYPSGENHQYTYDGEGNRVMEIINGTITTTYTYDLDNELLSHDGADYSYDHNGNLIQKTDSNGTTDYHYDFENRLVKIELPNASIVRFLYSPYGYRLSKIVDSTTTFYVYDFENMIMELDGDGIQKSKYTHGLSTDEPLNMLRSGLVSYYQCDGLGSVTALMDSNENVIATYVYDVFGKLSGQTGTLENPFRFTCREYDSESGLYYYRLRYYDANIGRFTTKDPLIAIDSMSTYVYAKNNPVIYVDPNGLEAKVKLGFEIASPSGTIRGLPQKTSNPLTKPEWIREDTICVYDPPTLELRFYVVLGPLFEKGWLEKRNVKIKEQENCRQKIKYELWMVTPKYDQHIEIRIAIWLKGQDFRRIDEAIQSLRKEVPDPVLGLPGRITGAVASKIPIAGDIYGMVTDCLDILQEADSNEEMNSALDKLDEEMRKLKQGDELEDIAWWLDMWKKRLDPDEDYQETREEIRPCQKPVITPSGGEPQPFREPPKDSPMPKPEITPGGQPEPQPCYFTPIVNPGIVALIPSESTVDATILNGGDSPQNVTVSVSYTLLLQSDPPIGTQTATLQLGANGTLTFPWAPPYRGLYEIKAEVLSLPDEFDTADNTRTVQISVSHIGSSQSDAPILNWAILTFGLVSAGAVFPSRKRRSKVLGWISGVVDIATSSLVAVPSPPNNRPNYHYTTNDSTHRLLRAQTNCSSRMDLCAAHGNTSMPAPTLQPSIPTYL